MLPQLSSGTTRRATVPVPRDLQAFCSSTCLTRFWRIPFKVLPYARFEAYWRHIGSAAPIVPGRAPFLARLYAAVTVPADRSKGGQPGVKRTASRISVPDSFIKPDSILTNSQVSRGQPGIRRTASRIVGHQSTPLETVLAEACTCQRANSVSLFQFSGQRVSMASVAKF